MTELIAGGFALFLAGLVQGCTGFGLAMVATPILVHLLPPTTVAPLLILLSTVNCIGVAWDARRHIKPRLVAPLVVGGALGFPLGGYILMNADPRYLKLGIGVFVMLFALALLRGWRWPLPERLRTLAPVGLVSGVLGGATSIGGPPAILFLASQDTPKDIFRASIVTYFAFTNFIGIAVYAALGVMTSAHLTLALTYVPFMLLGTVAGVSLARRIAEGPFQKAVLVFIAFVGGTLIATNT